MIKRWVVFVLLFVCVFSIRLWEGNFEKRWVVSTSPNSEDLYLIGIFIAETPYQNITIVETSSTANIEKKDGNYYIVYERRYPEMENSVYGKAVVVSHYLPEIKDDPLLDAQPIFPDNEKVMFNKFIKAKADELKNETVLQTIIALNNFVHEYVEYNKSAAQDSGAIEVYASRRGVCVEYTHLLMAMLNAVGIENRMVYGYAYSEKWEPHVWVEAYVPNYGWVDVDPTYDQVGFLDGMRVAMNIGDDRKGMYDSARLKNGQVDFEYSMYADPEHEEKFDLVWIDVDYAWPYFTVKVENKNGFYVFGAYEANFPEGISNSEKKTIILKPYETVVFRYRINEEELKNDYIYFVNARAKFLDDEKEARFEVRKPQPVVEKHEREKEWWEIIIEKINKFLFEIGKQMGWVQPV